MYPYFSRKRPRSDNTTDSEKTGLKALWQSDDVKLGDILSTAIAQEDYYIDFYGKLKDILDERYHELITSIIFDVTKSKRLLEYLYSKISDAPTEKDMVNTVKLPETQDGFLSLAILTEASEVKFFRELMLTLSDTKARNIMFEIMSDKLLHMNILNYIMERSRDSLTP